MVFKLHRPIYRLKQAFRSWNIYFDQAIKSFDFEQNTDESCVYNKCKWSMVIFLILYVDDILLIRNDAEALSIVKFWWKNHFDTNDLGEANYISEIKLLWDHCNKMIGLFQDTYINKFFVKFVIHNSKKLLPFSYGVPLSKE